MKRIVKSRIFLIILTAIIVSSVTVYAVNTYNASQIDFEPTNKNWNVSKVDKALDDLYTKANKQPTQVATLTTQGASYTMQNDGYIVGTAAGELVDVTTYGAQLLFNDSDIIVISMVDTRKVSVYAPSGTKVTTRTDRGTYNLTVYEWK